MKKVFYISDINLDKKSGVNKKILSQINAFSNIGMMVSYIVIKDGNIYYCNDGKMEYVEKLSKNKLIKRLQIVKVSMQIIKNSDDLDLIYIRYLFATPKVIKLLKIAKKKSIKVVEEIPTYPYDEELKNGKRLDLKLALMVDRHYRKKLKDYVFSFATFSDDDTIFGVNTIKIDNGVDVDSISPLDIQYEDNKINMIAVSVMEYWQGYDRLVKALNNYYKSKKDEEPEIILHFVGDGRELENLKDLVNQYNLEKNVIFYGFLSGKELDDVYNKCQCAIAGLGIFRKNIKKGKTLKIREYAAKAIPFIYSTVDDSITNFPYAYKVSDDEEIFDIHLVIDFLESLDKEKIKEDMRNFAETNYRWEKQMEKVIERVFNNERNRVQ